MVSLTQLLSDAWPIPAIKFFKWIVSIVPKINLSHILTLSWRSQTPLISFFLLLAGLFDFFLNLLLWFFLIHLSLGFWCYKLVFLLDQLGFAVLKWVFRCLRILGVRLILSLFGSLLVRSIPVVWFWGGIFWFHCLWCCLHGIRTRILCAWLFWVRNSVLLLSLAVICLMSDVRAIRVGLTFDGCI